MSSDDLLKQFAVALECVPVPGVANVCVITSKIAEADSSAVPEMTDAEWDKFEADIDEAFEQLP